jgi:exopolysaccharide production protein ExoQ
MNKVLYHLLPFWILGYYASRYLFGRNIQIAWFASLYLLAGFFVVTAWKRLLPYFSKEPLIILLIALTGLSFLWSIVPSITFASFRSLIVQHILISFIVLSYSFEKIIGFICKFFCGLGLMCFFNIFLTGGSLKSSWHGIFAHQSITAASMAIAIISLFYFFLIHEGWKKGWIFSSSTLLVGFICLLILATCGAKTSLMGCLISFSVVPLLYLEKIRKIRIRTFTLIAILYLSVIGTSIFYLMRKYIIVDLLGKSLDLTGRSFTWEFVLDKFWLKPWTGYGLDAFWHDPKIAVEFSNIVGRVIPSVYNTHNAYLDILIGLGIPGFALLLMLIIVVVRRVLNLVINYNDINAAWSLQIIILLLIAGYSDTFIGLLKARGIGWFLFSIISLKSIWLLSQVSNQKATVSFNPYLSKSRF